MAKVTFEFDPRFASLQPESGAALLDGFDYDPAKPFVEQVHEALERSPQMVVGMTVCADDATHLCADEHLAEFARMLTDLPEGTTFGGPVIAVRNGRVVSLAMRAPSAIPALPPIRVA